MTVIVATAVLHNIAVDMHEEIPPRWNEYEGDNGNAIPNTPQLNQNNSGRQFKQLFINEHFARL